MENRDVSGKAVVFQSGGPTRVINASLDGVCSRIHTYIIDERSSDRFPRIRSLFGAKNGIEGILKEGFYNLVDEAGNYREDSEGLAHTPGDALGTTRYELYKKDKKTKVITIKEDDCKRIIDVFKAYDIHYVFGIGGNDTAETSLILARFAEQENYPLTLIHIPKTIDNDLMETDHSPGYGGAARFVVSCVGGTALDMRSMSSELAKTIDITVTMGRNAGWLAASASLIERIGVEPPLIFVPENPMDIKEFVEAVAEEYGREGHCQVVVSEGMKTLEGGERGKEWVELLIEKYMPEKKEEELDIDVTGRMVLSKTPLANLLEAELKSAIKGARFVPNQLGYAQRCSLGSYSKTDFNEARKVGKTAVEYALEGKNSVMVALRREVGNSYCSYTEAVPLDRVANIGKKLIQVLPDSCIDVKTNRINEAFLNYASPLADVDTMEKAVMLISEMVTDKKLPEYEIKK